MLVPPERGVIIGRAIWKVGSHSEFCWIFVRSDAFLPAAICRPGDGIHDEDPERPHAATRELRKVRGRTQRLKAAFVEAKSSRCVATGSRREGTFHLHL